MIHSGLLDIIRKCIHCKQRKSTLSVVHVQGRRLKHENFAD